MNYMKSWKCGRQHPKSPQARRRRKTAGGESQKNPKFVV
jgi:hypothetical protein